MRMQKIGIMGGTFDPVHYGHLVIAESARNRFDLDKVVFIPSGTPPHKRQLNTSSAAHRLEMTALAIASNPHFIVSRIELERQGFSYSVDTVSALLEKYGADTSVYFIAGTDTVGDLPTWHKAEKLLQLCTFIAAVRPGFDPNSLNKLPASWRANIALMETPSLEISSTDIRRRVREGESIKYLLPEPVEAYIYAQKLYK